VKEDCCGRPEVSAALLTCPACGTSGRPVPRVTPRSLAVVPEAIRDERYRFCGSPNCDVVWYGEGTGHVLHRADVRVRVGVKETAVNRPLCYCFGFSEADARDRADGGPVELAILARCQRGEDRCSETNPQGLCCIGNIRAAVGR